MENAIDRLIEFGVLYGPRLLGSIVVLLIGIKLISVFSKWFYRALERREVDASLRPFLRSLLAVALKVLLVISVMSMIGVAMTSFIAIIGAIGLAVGLALSGTLQNFAGGVIILIIRPFKVGDFIKAQDYMGTVLEIQIFNTILKTPDNITIILPNGNLSTNPITNFSVQPTRRAEWVFGIAYGDSFDKAKEIILDLIENDSRLLKDPEPFIAISELADSSVDIKVRAWAKSGDFWPVYFEMHEKVYKAFNEKGINIPFPQMDVHLHKQ